MRINVVLVFIIGILFLFQFCDTNSPEPESTTGKVKIEFAHRVDGENLVYDSLAYLNDAGNKYLVNEIQYFISDVYLINESDNKIYLNNWNDIHYVDSDIKETLSVIFNESIEKGTYISVGFTFGINEEKNQSLMFVNPPESFMFWPENLGGGYHYMKLNGKWLNDQNQLAPFNFHLGIGQIYFSYPDSISEFVQNYFQVELTDRIIKISENNTTVIELVMNVNNWFRTPNLYDHNVWGGDIMQNQNAMKAAVENGSDVFSYKLLE